jgi:hypothetical protein
MTGWIGIMAFSVLVRVLVSHVRQDRPALPPRLFPPSMPRLRPVRPRVHRVLATAQDGEFVTLTGRIQGSTDPLTAPLSGTPCVAYLAVAQAWPDARGPKPAVNAREMKAVPLVVSVEDGEITIDSECVVMLRTTPVVPAAPERAAEFLARRQLQDHVPSMMFKEGVVRAGDRIWVRGNLVRERDRRGEHGYRDLAERIRLVSRPGRPLTIGRSRR